MGFLFAEMANKKWDFFFKNDQEKRGYPKKFQLSWDIFLKIDLQTGFISKNDQITGHFYNIDQDLQTWQK